MEFYWFSFYPLIVLTIVRNAQAQRQREEEEEERGLDSLLADDGWEYKILTSPRARFRDAAGLADALAGESPAGWTLLEKLDARRLRLQRPVAARAQDSSLDFDAYRSTLPRTVSVPSGGAR